MQNSKLVLALASLALGGACFRVGDSRGGDNGGPPATDPPKLGFGDVARYYDKNRDGQPGAGDLVVVPFDLPVKVNDPRVASLVLSGTEDSFGTGATLVAGPRANEVSVRLGDGAQIKTRQQFSAAAASDLHPASGIGLTDDLAADAIENAVTGADAIPGATLDIVPAFVDRMPLPIDPVLTAATADFDRDGAPDVVVTRVGGGAQLLLGNGAGGFEPQTPFATPTAPAVAHGDVDRDGMLDLVLGGPDGLRVWIGDGTGQFLPGVAPQWQGEVRSVVLSDIDLDGDLDAVAGTSPGLATFQGDGRGSFGDPEFFAETLESSALATADADGDGLDEVFAGTADGVVIFHRTAGTYTQLTELAGSEVRALALADIDGNGKLDVLTAERVGSRFWHGDGAGGFATAELVLEDEPSAAVGVVDIDSDGRLDLLVGATGGLRVLFQTDPGSFVDSDQALTGTTNLALASEDLDLDGDVDLVLVASTGATQTSFGSLAGTWGGVAFKERGSVLSSGVTFSFAAGDVDRDGNLDLLAGQNNRLALLRGEGDGTFAATEAIFEVPDQRVNDVSLGDVDLDGDPDIVLGLQGSAPFVWLNDGAGHFEAFDQVQNNGLLVKAVELGDIDNDGDLDLVLGTMDQEADAVRRNLGHSGGTGAGQSDAWLGFGPPELLVEDGEPLLAHTGDLRLADFDRDGDLDLFCGYGPHQDERWFRNDGTGAFSIEPQILGTLDCRSATTGDIDRDGDLDLVTGTNIGEHVFLNDGSAEFVEFGDLSVSSTYVVKLVDLTGDGALELLIGNSLEQGLGAWLNDGTGRFGTVPWIRLSHRSIRAVLPADFDRDGDIDLVSTNIVDQSIRMWHNR